MNVTLNANTMGNGHFTHILSPNTPVNVTFNANNNGNGHFTHIEP